MANKPNSNRQKLVFRLEPAQTKPRNPLVTQVIYKSGAGLHQKNHSALRQQGKQALKNLAIKDEED